MFIYFHVDFLLYLTGVCLASVSIASQVAIVNIYIIMKACGQRFDRQHLINSRASGLVSKSPQT